MAVTVAVRLKQEEVRTGMRGNSTRWVNSEYIYMYVFASMEGSCYDS